MVKLKFQAFDKYHNEVRPVEEIGWKYGEIEYIALDTYTFFSETFSMIELRIFKGIRDGKEVYKPIKI